MIHSRNGMATHGAAAAALALLLLGCAERHPVGSVALRLTRGHASPTVAGGGAIVARGRDSIIVRQAELVLREIQLAPAGSGECEPEEEAEEACAPLEMGPLLVTLPLGDGAAPLPSVRVPADTYSVFLFGLHPPDASQDGAFLAAHPDFAGTSIRVQGTYSRAGKRRDFVYASGFSEQEETPLTPPLAVPPDTTVSVTLRLELANWFLNADKTALVDPSTANSGQLNQDLVHDNIRTSVAAFGDEGHDGERVRAASPWPADSDSGAGAARPVSDRAAATAVPQCRREAPRITPDSIGPFRLDASLADLQRECPHLTYGWVSDPDGFAVPTVAARLGEAAVTALFTDTLPNATVREVSLEDSGPGGPRGPRTVEGLGVGSTLRELQRAYGAPGAAEPGCVLRIWFPSLPGVAFRMAFPTHEQRECGSLSEGPLPPDLRVASVILVPR